MLRDLFRDVGGFDPEQPAAQHRELGLRLGPALAERKPRTGAVMRPLVERWAGRRDQIRSDDAAVLTGASRIFLNLHGRRLARSTAVSSPTRQRRPRIGPSVSVTSARLVGSCCWQCVPAPEIPAIGCVFVHSSSRASCNNASFVDRRMPRDEYSPSALASPSCPPIGSQGIRHGTLWRAAIFAVPVARLGFAGSRRTAHPRGRTQLAPTAGPWSDTVFCGCICPGELNVASRSYRLLHIAPERGEYAVDLPQLPT